MTKTIAALFLLALPLSSRAREPVPFVEPYRDGYVLVLWGEGRSEAEHADILDRVARSGSRHLTLPVFGCQSGLESSDVGACEVQTRAYVIGLARQAQARGMTVSFLPIVVTPDWKWRGFFEPADTEAWFRSYTDWIRALARDARALGMSELVVGTEFSKLYRHTEGWKRVLRDVRREFAGPLVVTVNHGGENVGFWDEADAIGVSAYYPLSARVGGAVTQAELDRAWQARKRELLELSRRWRRPLHLTEVGYHASSDAAKTPWASEPGSVPDAALQARCFEALRKAWEGERALVRLGVWAAGDPAAQHPQGFDPIGREGGAVLERFFHARALLAR
jgi:hypothetical protein